MHSWSSWLFELMTVIQIENDWESDRQNITLVKCKQVILKYGRKKKGQITSDENSKPQSI